MVSHKTDSSSTAWPSGQSLPSLPSLVLLKSTAIYSIFIWSALVMHYSHGGACYLTFHHILLLFIHYTRNAPTASLHNLQHAQLFTGHQYMLKTTFLFLIGKHIASTYMLLHSFFVETSSFIYLSFNLAFLGGKAFVSALCLQISWAVRVCIIYLGGYLCVLIARAGASSLLFASR